MSERIQIRLRSSHKKNQEAPPEAPGNNSPAAPEATDAPPPQASGEEPVEQSMADTVESAAPAVFQSHDTMENGNNTELEQQAQELASQLLDVDNLPLPLPVPQGNESTEESSGFSGNLKFKKKSQETQPEKARRKKRARIKVDINVPQMDIAVAVLLFFAGTVLLAISMFGIDSQPEILSPVTLVGICAAQAIFLFLLFTPFRTLETFARTLVGALTLFASLTSVGVFLAEAFLVPILGFSLVRDMPSAPLAGSAALVFAACLILVARQRKTNWMVVLLCLLAAGIIPVLPVQHFMHVDLNAYRTNLLRFFMTIRITGF